jgi:hypothetical protein
MCNGLRCNVPRISWVLRTKYLIIRDTYTARIITEYGVLVLQ